MNKFLISLALILGIFGCKSEGLTNAEIEALRAERGAAPTEQAVDIQLDAGDFDGQLLTSLFKENKIPGGIAGIETFINAPGNPINFVDLDKDQKIDYVKMQETREGQTVVLEFVACKSTNPNLPENQVTVWTLRLADGPAGYSLVGGYPDYVGNRTYVNYTVPRSHGLSFGEAYLLAHLLMPRPLYISPGWGGGYIGRPMVGMTTRYQVQNTYRTQNRITPVPRTMSRPSTFSAGPQAAKATSRFAERANAIQSRQSFNSGSGLKSFRTQQSSGSLNTSGFRSSPTTSRPTTSTPSRASSPSRSSFGGSRSSFGGGRSSFGGSRGGRR